jgi:putative peptidoglycan lipid II flippase
MLLLGLPAALCMVMMADALVATLFHYGAFNASDVSQTRLAVMAYSVGLVGLLTIKILAPGFYAKQDIRTPVKIAICVLVLTQVLNLFLVPWLAHTGLALAIGLGACLNALALYIGLRRKKIYQPASGWGVFLLRQTCALLVMAVPLWLAANQIDWIALQPTPWLRVLWLLVALAFSGTCYLLTLLGLGMRLKHFRRAPDATQTPNLTQ